MSKVDTLIVLLQSALVKVFSNDPFNDAVKQSFIVGIITCVSIGTGEYCYSKPSSQ